MGVITHISEEPYVKSTSTVLWELGRATVLATRRQRVAPTGVVPVFYGGPSVA